MGGGEEWKKKTILKAYPITSEQKKVSLPIQMSYLAILRAASILRTLPAIELNELELQEPRLTVNYNSWLIMIGLFCLIVCFCLGVRVVTYMANWDPSSYSKLFKVTQLVHSNSRIQIHICQTPQSNTEALTNTTLQPFLTVHEQKDEFIFIFYIQEGDSDDTLRGDLQEVFSNNCQKREHKIKS